MAEFTDEQRALMKVVARTLAHEIKKAAQWAANQEGRGHESERIMEFGEAYTAHLAGAVAAAGAAVTDRPLESVLSRLCTDAVEPAYAYRREGMI